MKKKVLAPEQQGHIDGMCAIYAVVNGCKLLFEHTETMDKRLFKELCRENAELFPKIVYGGTESPGLRRLLRTAARWALRVHRRELSFAFVARRRKFDDVNMFFSYLRDAMAHESCEKTAAILGIDKPWDHWTAVRSIGAQRATFFDSWGFPAWTAFDYFTFDPAKAGEKDNQKSLLAYRQTLVLRAPALAQPIRTRENIRS